MNIHRYLLISLSIASLICIFPSITYSASFYLSPPNGAYDIESNFSITLKVDTSGQTINAAEGVLSFDPTLMEVQNISKDGSIFGLWPVEPSYSNSNGSIRFSGGRIPGGSIGFNGSAGKVLTILFRSKSVGAASLNFFSGAILASDSQGTNILKVMDGGNYILLVSNSSTANNAFSAPQIFSDTHPNQDQWYNQNTLGLFWILPENSTGVSFLLDQKRSGRPGNVSDGMLDSKSFSDLEEGIWYFHLKTRDEFGWSEDGHFKAQIDLTPPSDFEMVLIDGEETANPRPAILLKAEDKLSGLSRFQLEINGGNEIIVRHEDLTHNLYRLPAQKPGSRAVVGRAYDKAGNYSERQAVINVLPGAAAPMLNLENINYRLLLNAIIITALSVLLFLLIIVLAIGWYRQKYHRGRLEKEIADVESALRAGTTVLKHEILKEFNEQKKPLRIKDIKRRDKSAGQKLATDVDMIEKVIEKEVGEIKKELK